MNVNNQYVLGDHGPAVRDNLKSRLRFAVAGVTIPIFVAGFLICMFNMPWFGLPSEVREHTIIGVVCNALVGFLSIVMATEAKGNFMIGVWARYFAPFVGFNISSKQIKKMLGTHYPGDGSWMQFTKGNTRYFVIPIDRSVGFTYMLRFGSKDHKYNTSLIRRSFLHSRTLFDSKFDSATLEKAMKQIFHMYVRNEIFFCVGQPASDPDIKLIPGVIQRACRICDGEEPWIDGVWLPTASYPQPIAVTSQQDWEYFIALAKLLSLPKEELQAHEAIHMLKNL